MLRLIVLSGLPGSGKSTVADLFRFPGSVILRRDDMRRDGESESKLSMRMLLEAYEELLKGNSVIIDSPNLLASDRHYWEAVGLVTRAMFTWIVVETPVDVCIERDASREKSIGATKILEMQKEYYENRPQTTVT